MTCPSCGTALDLDANVRRIFCSHACRQMAQRARDKRRHATALDLVLRQSRAIQAGDRVALAQVILDAERLLS